MAEPLCLTTVSAARDRLPEWFGELRGPLRRYLLCAGAEAGDADEAVQETFLKLQAQLAASVELTNVRAWVFQVARNFVRDTRKSAHRQRSAMLDERIPDPGLNPEHAALRAEEFRRLGDAVRRLPEDERECMLLRSSGLRYREVAEIMSIDTNRVGLLVHRATGRLRQELS